MLPRSCQLVKKRCLSAILISDKRKGKRHSLRQRISAALRMILTALSESRMLVHVFFLFLVFLNTSCRRFYRYLRSIIQPQCQLIAVQAYFHGITHGRKFYDFHFCSRDDPHIQKVLAKSTASTNGNNSRRFTDV